MDHLCEKETIRTLAWGRSATAVTPRHNSPIRVRSAFVGMRASMPVCARDTEATSRLPKNAFEA